MYTVYDADSLDAVATLTLPATSGDFPLAASADGRVLVGEYGTVWVRAGSTFHRVVPGLPSWVLGRHDLFPKTSDDGRFVLTLQEGEIPNAKAVIACDPHGWDGTGTMPCARVVPASGA
jgi:hypothetical protein